MAIDSAEKRRNIAASVTIVAPGVTPNASKDREWRQQAGWGYSGIVPQSINLLANYPYFRGLLRFPGKMLH
ncbi:MAG: hypothetical protein QNJ92_17355 [Alphaproteobacteria bacterium]|nr:hypothetical protein [Alphaproteobacteria bacterium]